MSNKNYKGIFNALESLGHDASLQMITSLREMRIISSADSELSQRNKKFVEEIHNLNKRVIELSGGVKKLQSNADKKTHNKKVLDQLKKIDVLIKKANEHLNYAKRTDKVKIDKLNRIYTEILKLSSNTAALLPEVAELSEQDMIALELLKKSLQNKYDYKFEQASAMLEKAAELTGLSGDIEKTISNEQNLGLPLFEAQIKVSQLGRKFQQPEYQATYTEKIAYIKQLYTGVLENDDLSFKQRVDVKLKLDQLLVTSEAMDATVEYVNANNEHNLKMLLRIWRQRYNVGVATGSTGSNRENCPTSNEMDGMIRQASLTYKLEKFDRKQCKLVFKITEGKYLVFDIHADSGVETREISNLKH